MNDKKRKKQIAGELEDVVEDAQELAEDLGLEPSDVNYWVVDYDEMNKLIAYDGFQTRYSHWRWGMKYDKQRKESVHGGGKVFEIVNHDTPCNAFLQESNSMAGQKAVITHVEAHADFFNNNQWFPDDVNAAEMLENHAQKVDRIIKDSDVSREEVEKWIDMLLCIEDNIDQHRPMKNDLTQKGSDESNLEQKVESLEVSDTIKEGLFDDEWIEKQTEEDTSIQFEEEDIFAFLLEFGKQYDEDSEKAVEYEDWQRELINIIRKESYYFAPQKFTKVMNEGWASFWQTLMMSDEGFADEGEVIDHADHQSKVLGAPGLNPYKLGNALWEYVENKENRKEVVTKLLRVDGINWENFRAKVNFEEIQNLLVENADSDVLEEKHYSLTRPQNTGFIKNISRDELEQIGRYLFDTDRYDSIEEAMAEVDYGAGWERMREVRASHNDVMFLDEYLTPEFILEQEFFTYEYDNRHEKFKIASREAEDVKKKLLLQFTNFGKPTIYAQDYNYNNKNELLLVHDYNGVMLDISEAERVFERIFDAWGRPINLKTIVKNEDKEEQGMLLRYDGETMERKKLDWEDVEDIAADDIDYDTKPDEWT